VDETSPGDEGMVDILFFALLFWKIAGVGDVGVAGGIWIERERIEATGGARLLLGYSRIPLCGLNIGKSSGGWNIAEGSMCEMEGVGRGFRLRY
jgi:hypothetical protein